MFEWAGLCFEQLLIKLYKLKFSKSFLRYNTNFFKHKQQQIYKDEYMRDLLMKNETIMHGSLVERDSILKHGVMNEWSEKRFGE